MLFFVIALVLTTFIAQWSAYNIMSGGKCSIPVHRKKVFLMLPGLGVVLVFKFDGHLKYVSSAFFPKK